MSALVFHLGADFIRRGHCLGCALENSCFQVSEMGGVGGGGCSPHPPAMMSVLDEGQRGLWIQELAASGGSCWSLGKGIERIRIGWTV